MKNTTKNTNETESKPLTPERPFRLGFKVGKYLKLAKHGRFKKLSKKAMRALSYYPSEAFYHYLYTVANILPTIKYKLIFVRSHGTGGHSLIVFLNMLGIRDIRLPISEKGRCRGVKAMHGETTCLLIDRYFSSPAHDFMLSHLRYKAPLLHLLRDPVDNMKSIINFQNIRILNPEVVSSKDIVNIHAYLYEDLIPQLFNGSNARALAPLATKRLVIFTSDLIGERFMPTLHKIAKFLGKDDALIQRYGKNINYGHDIIQFFPLFIEHEGIRYIVTPMELALPCLSAIDCENNIVRNLYDVFNAHEVFEGLVHLFTLDTREMKSHSELYPKLEVFVDKETYEARPWLNVANFKPDALEASKASKNKSYIYIYIYMERQLAEFMRRLEPVPKSARVREHHAYSSEEIIDYIASYNPAIFYTMKSQVELLCKVYHDEPGFLSRLPKEFASYYKLKARMEGADK